MLAGCGTTTIDSGKAEAFLRRAISPAPSSVSCPSNVKAQAGRTFQCTFVGADGRNYSVTMHMTNSSGGVQVSRSDVQLSSSP